MKKNKSTLFKVSMVALITLITTLGILISCEKENFSPLKQESRQQSEMPVEILQEFPTVGFCGHVVSKRILLFEKNIVGTAFIFNDRNYLYVHAIAHEGIKFHNAYLYAGMKDEVPMTSSGDPNYKGFANKIENAGLTTARTFKVPLKFLGGNFALSLMLEVKHESSDGNMMIPLHAWAEGYAIGEHLGQKGLMFAYRKGICLYEEREDVTEEIQ